MMRADAHPAASKSRHGFTLTELAIVLIVVAIVIGAIWVAGQMVWNNYRVYRVNQQVMTVLQNVRDYYGTSMQALPFAAGTEITVNLDGLGLIPAEMRRSPSTAPGTAPDPIDHAINNDWPAYNGYSAGSFHVIAETNAAAGSATVNVIRIALEGLTQGPCMKLLMNAPVTDVATVGLVQLGTGSMMAAAAGSMPLAMPIGNTFNLLPSSTVITYGGAGGLTTTATQITSKLAQTWCTDATGNTNEVDFDFKLHN